MYMDSDGKRAAILGLLMGYPSSSRLSDAQVETYCSSFEDRSLDAVRRMCQQFEDGDVLGHDNAFIPTVPEMRAKAREWDEAIAAVTAAREIGAASRIVSYPIGGKPPPGYTALGELEERRNQEAIAARAKGQQVVAKLKKMDGRQ